jgi:hypothetical protein
MKQCSAGVVGAVRGTAVHRAAHRYLALTLITLNSVSPVPESTCLTAM